MPRKLNIESVKGRMPVRYRVHPGIRIPMLGLSLLIALWCLYVLFFHVNSDTGMFFKLLPAMVLFIALDSLVRQLTSLNSVIFTPDCIWFRYLLRPSTAIPYDKFIAMEFRKSISYNLHITYTDGRGRKKEFKTSASFPKILEIMFNIADLCPQLVMNEDLQKMMNVMKDIKARQAQE